MTGPTEVFARHAAERSRAWPDAARHGAERAFVDTVACIIAGRDDEATRRASAATLAWGKGGAAHIVTDRGGASAPVAALVNGAAAHALDYDDVLEPAAAHASAVLVPALLALGEERKVSGERLVDALLIGFDVLAALGMSVNMGHYSRGWHTTVTLGSPAAAAACGRLIGLDAKRMRAAISAATSFSSASKRQFGTNMKPVHAGLAAQAGILAACLAEQGITAAEEILEGPWSFTDLFGGPGMPGFAKLAEQLAGPPAMERYGAWVKAYPCCASAHRPIDAIKELRRKAGLTPDNVAAIEAHVSEIVIKNLMYPRPTNEMQARFSINHCLSLASRSDQLKVADFTPATIAEARHTAFWPKVKMTLNPALSASMSAEPGTENARVVATLTDGRKVESSVVFPKGHPGSPLTDAELAAKYDDCTSGARDPKAAARVRDVLFALGKRNDMDTLWSNLRAA